jgi:tellurite methyltransferase
VCDMFVDRLAFWNDRYEKLDKKLTIDPFLTENCHLLPKDGQALDVACGLGGNSLFLAKCNLQVEAWDFSPNAISQLQVEAKRQDVEISVKVRDVLESSWPSQSYDVITVSRFLDHSIVPSLIQALKPGGLLFYQTFVQLKVAGRGPENSAFRLEKNELLSLFIPALELVFFREEWDIGAGDSEGRDMAFLIGRRPDKA